MLVHMEITERNPVGFTERHRLALQ